MALKGTLKDFSIADIFQLIGQQQKSGSLYITNKDQIAHIMFDKGMVVISRFKQSNEDLMFGNMLLRADIITESQLQEAMENQQETLRNIGDILLGMNYITPETLSEFVSLQIKEVLFRLFQWKEGLYEFIPEEFKYNKKILKPQRGEQLLLDGFRMLDEWPSILKKISSLTAIYKPTIDTSNLSPRKEGDKDEVSIDEEIDMAFKEFDDSGKSVRSETKKGETLSQEEKRVILLIDGQRTIKEVADLSRFGTFNTCSIIISLLDKCVIAKADVDSSSRIEAQAAFKTTFISKKKQLSRIAVDLIVLGLLAFGAPSLIFYFYSNIMSGSSVKGGFFINVGENPLKDYLKNNKLEQVRFALELYRLNNETYPDNLNELTKEKLLLPETIDPNFYFRKTGNTYILLP